MSNREKAAKIIHHMTGDLPRAHDVVEELAQTDLLVLDLPEPRIDIGEWQEWGHKHGTSVTLENGKITVYIPDDISRDITPGEARELAAWLNAAANYSQEGNREKETGNIDSRF